MRGVRPLLRDRAEVAIAVWAALQTFHRLAESDRFFVLFTLDLVALPWVVLLWAKNLLLSAVVASAFVGLLRLTAKLEDDSELVAPTARRPAPIAVLAVVAIGAGGGLARWALPDELPPGLWCDVAYEAEAALDAPEGGPAWGGIPLQLDGRRSSTMVSNLYLEFCRGSFALFGSGEAGLRAVSVVPATLLPFAGAALATLAWGTRSGIVAFGLLSLCRWPIIFSYWTWTGTAVALLTTTAAVALADSFRRESRAGPALAGLFTGLSFHAHPASAGAALGLGFAALPWFRSRAGWRRIALGAAAAALAAVPFFVAFLEHPSRIGGRTRDVSAFSESRRAGVPQTVPLRLAENLVQYSGFFLFTTDPNPRHNIPGRASMNPVVGIAVAVGAALALRRALSGRNQDRLILSLAVGGLLPGILSSPAGAPNSTRAVAAMVPLLLLATGPLIAWGGAVGRLLRVRPDAVAALALALLVALESTEVPRRWAADPLVVSYFGPEETALGRTLRGLAPFPAVVAPLAVRDPIVVEACALPFRPVEPLRRMPRLAPASLCADPPAGPFWYVAWERDLAELRSAGFGVARGTGSQAGRPGPVLAWVRPPLRDTGGRPLSKALPGP